MLVAGNPGLDGCHPGFDQRCVHTPTASSEHLGRRVASLFVRAHPGRHRPATSRPRHHSRASIERRLGCTSRRRQRRTPPHSRSTRDRPSAGGSTVNWTRQFPRPRRFAAGARKRAVEPGDAIKPDRSTGCRCVMRRITRFCGPNRERRRNDTSSRSPPTIESTDQHQRHRKQLARQR